LEARVVGVTGPLWEEFTVEGVSKGVGLQYHPGSIRFYQERVCCQIQSKIKRR
jgi:hypothetical protein